MTVPCDRTTIDAPPARGDRELPAAVALAVTLMIFSRDRGAGGKDSGLIKCGEKLLQVCAGFQVG